MEISRNVPPNESLSRRENERALKEGHGECIRLDRELQIQIKQTQIRLGQLNQQRMAELGSATGPSNDLPPEIWSLIFEFAHGNDIYYIPGPYYPDDSNCVNPKTCFPERVCHTWRKIAFSTPALWRRVTISYASFIANDIHSGSPQVLNELTAFAGQLTRMGGAKDLTIHLASSDCDEGIEALALVKELTLPLALRLERLSVSKRCGSPNFLIGLLELLPSLPSLHVFTDLCYNDEEDDTMTGAFAVPISNATFSTLSGLYIGTSTGGGMQLSTQMAHYLLSMCPQLRDCSMTIDPDAEALGFDFILPNGQIELENLSSLHLTIQAIDAAVTKVILDPLVVPSLKKFRILNPVTESDLSLFHTLKDLLQRSRCSFETHLIHTTPVSMDGLMDYLTMVPDAEEFSFTSPEPVPWTLLEKIGSAELLPKLKKLTLHLSSDATTISALTTMARKRWGGRNGTDIHDLMVLYSSDRGRDGCSEMKALQEQLTVEGRTCSFEEIEMGSDSNSDDMFWDSDSSDAYVTCRTGPDNNLTNTTSTVLPTLTYRWTYQ